MSDEGSLKELKILRELSCDAPSHPINQKELKFATLGHEEAI